MRYAVEPMLTEKSSARREQERQAAQRMLSRLLGYEAKIGHYEDGRPFVESKPDVFVSISHCKKAVAVAVSEEGAVGIDVESRRRVSESLVERVCTEGERREISMADDAEMCFLRFWTRKEAVLKCRGTGIKGFDSLKEASLAEDCEVREVESGVEDVVCTVATAKGEWFGGIRRGGV